MGKQYNKAEKRQRRLSYIKRKQKKGKIKAPAASPTVVAPPAVPAAPVVEVPPPVDASTVVADAGGAAPAVSA
jgi:hypothetical protein